MHCRSPPHALSCPAYLAQPRPAQQPDQVHPRLLRQPCVSDNYETPKTYSLPAAMPRLGRSKHQARAKPTASALQSTRTLSPRWVRPPGFVFAPVRIQSRARPWYLQIFLECFPLPGHMGQPLETSLQEFLFSWTACPRILAYLPVQDWARLSQLNDECHHPRVACLTLGLAYWWWP